jgi:16S rRNA (guanine527-N7)-methyltransferase
LLSAYHEALEAGLLEMGLTTTHAQREKWIAYICLLEKWNHRFNLTGLDVAGEMISRHLLDSLAIAPYVVGERVLDVGTGAGLPGIPLAIYYPDKTFTLLDSNHKKHIFVKQAIRQLTLINVESAHTLVQTYQPTQKFSTILTRAFAPIHEAREVVFPLLSQDGKWLAMIGKETPDMESLVKLNIPGEKAQRHLAIITR